MPPSRGKNEQSAQDRLLKDARQVEWQNTRLVKDNIDEEMKKMINQPGKNMAILGAAVLYPILRNMA